VYIYYVIIYGAVAIIFCMQARKMFLIQHCEKYFLTGRVATVLTASRPWENSLRKGLRVKNARTLTSSVHFNIAYLRPQFLACLKGVFHLGDSSNSPVNPSGLSTRVSLFCKFFCIMWHISAAYTRNWGIYNVLFVAWTKHRLWQNWQHTQENNFIPISWFKYCKR